MVNISTPKNNDNNITVSSNSTNNAVNTKNSIVFLEGMSEQWATKMDGKVNNEDYSSKYYAEKSKISAETAKLEASNATAIREELEVNFESYNNQLQTLTDNSKESINVLTEVSLTELQNKSASSQNEISSFVATSLEDFSSSASLITSNSKTDIQNSATVAKNTAISEIQAQEIESINNVQEEGIIQTNLIKDQVDLAETQAQISKQQADIAKQQVQLAKDEVAKISNVYKFKGSVANFESLPSTADNGDVYDVLDTGANYAWTGTEWDSLGGALNVDVSDVVHLDGEETITGEKTFTKPIKIQNGQGTGCMWVGANVNSDKLTNNSRHLARISTPSFSNVDLATTLLGFDSGGDSALHVANKNYDAVSFGGQKKITNATSPMSIGFCVTNEREATSANNKVYALEMDANEARFNVQPNYNGINLATTVDLETKQNVLTAGENITIENGIISATGGGGSGFSLFDIVQKDHVLSFEESKGLAMLGSYVYKNGVAGSRYGYADFYEKCLEEYENSESVTIPSVTVTGSISNNDGVLSGFSNGGYVIPEPDITVASGQSFELALNVKTGSTANGMIVDFGRNGQIVGLLVVTDGQLQLLMISLDVSNMISCGTLSPNTSYDIVMNYSDSVLTVKVNGETTYTSGVFTTNQMTFCFGGQHSVGGTFTGTINLRKSHITVDNQVVWGDIYKKSANGHTFYDIANKSAVDQLFESRGEAMFYGIDEENERIFLPRRTRTQTTLNPTEVNNFVEAGLPNITGQYALDQNASSLLNTKGIFQGAFTYKPSLSGGINGVNYRENANERDLAFDASLSNPIYGNSDTVQPSGSLVLEYMVVGNVTVDKAQTDVTEITTSENDTLPLFYNFYSDEDMTTTGAYINASEGGWHSGNVYLTAYNELVNKLGTGNVKAVTDTFTDYDFVVNQDEMTFRLPLLNGGEDTPDYSLGVSKDVSFISDRACEMVICAYRSASGVALIKVTINDTTLDFGIGGGYGYVNIPVRLKANDVVNVNINYTANSGIEINYINCYPLKGNGNLYYKVNNALSNLAIMDVAEIEATKADKTAVDGQWIQIYKDLLSGVTFKDNQVVTVDLSDILPNDGYTYECIFSCWIRTGSTSSNAIDCQLFSGTGDSLNQFYARLARCVTRTNSTASAAGCAILPILPNDRAVTWKNGDGGGTSGSCGLVFGGYRRVGTNV